MSVVAWIASCLACLFVGLAVGGFVVGLNAGRRLHAAADRIRHLEADALDGTEPEDGAE